MKALTRYWETSPIIRTEVLKYNFLSQICRIWQAVALSVWGAAAAVAASGSRDGVQLCYLLLIECMRLPTVSSLALASPAGRSTVLCMYERFLAADGEEAASGDESGPEEVGLVGSSLAGHVANCFWWALNDVAATGTAEAALALARTGALSRLVRWAAEKSALPAEEVGGSPPGAGA